MLDTRGAFVESAPNLWIAELRQRATIDQTKALGHRIPYLIFLATTIGPGVKASDLAKEFMIERSVVRHAVRVLSLADVLYVKTRRLLYPNAKLRYWLRKYIELSTSHADTTGDPYYLFSAVPSYIGGPAAKYAIRYVPGSPIGPSDMTIITYEPFKKFWEALVKEATYFKDYPRKVIVQLARPSDTIVEIDGISYKRNLRSRAKPAP